MKFLKICAVLFLLLLALGTTVACEDEEETTQTTAHTHTYENEWLPSSEGHYKNCICHPNVKEFQSHLDGSDKDGLCDLCSFVMKQKQVYTITLVDTEGNFVHNATIRVSTTASSIEGVTNEQGTFLAEFVYADSINVVILSLPEGYHVDKKTYKMNQSTLVISDIINIQP